MFIHGLHMSIYSQVALGKPKGEFSGKYIEEAEEGFNSTVGIGRETPDKTYDVTLPTGIEAYRLWSLSLDSVKS